ncbi:hypothetical protein DFQ28_007683 [Apophysomyces sp. BC1034]|nr:hypothetical protein DFQ30_004486 [Apophysomyces sp. BC1015]KAG0180150.1 hypothetical protein DFQ29_001164 [Apophysomyces sp. BC1021]KAG0192780.1 hypothetical protein DFQ28_007683 [Apophysomyces sp. BC1034]
MKNPFSTQPEKEDHHQQTTTVVNSWESDSPDQIESLQETQIVTITEKTEVQDHQTVTIDSVKEAEATGVEATNIEASPQPEVVKEDHKPNKGRLCFRFWQVLAAIGAFGFQVGATPYSQQPMPFSTKGLLYYVYAICWVSFLWSLFMIFVYLTRRFGHAGKVKRPVLFAVDVLLAAMFGVGIFYEIAEYRCPPGDYNGWCNFFNTGLFFLMSLFVTYVLLALWDLFGGLSLLRSKRQ